MSGLDSLVRHEEQSRAKVVETLRFYAEEDAYRLDPNRVRPVIADKGAKAREALTMMGESI